MYDPAIARFTGVDPLADSYDLAPWSPYNYVFNNPVRLTDPDGRAPSATNCCGGTTPTAAGFVFEAFTNARAGIFNIGMRVIETVGLGDENTSTRMRVNSDGNGGIPYGNPTRIVKEPKKGLLGEVGDTVLDGLSISPLARSKGMSGPFLAARIPNPKASFLNFLRRGEDGQSLYSAKGKDFKLFHSESEITGAAGYSDIKNLSDNQLLDAIRNPADGQYIKINSETGQLINGNTRIYELQRRGLGNQKVTFESYTPKPPPSIHYEML